MFSTSKFVFNLPKACNYVLTTPMVQFKLGTTIATQGFRSTSKADSISSKVQEKQVGFLLSFFHLCFFFPFFFFSQLELLSDFKDPSVEFPEFNLLQLISRTSRKTAPKVQRLFSRLVQELGFVSRFQGSHKVSSRTNNFSKNSHNFSSNWTQDQPLITRQIGPATRTNKDTTLQQI